MTSSRPTLARDNDPAAPTLQELARGAADAAATIERGQAEQPLADLSRALLRQEAEPWSVAVLAMSPVARDAALAWLLGAPHAAVSARVVESAASIDLQLRAHGYAIETDSGGRREFHSAEAFSAALADAMQAGGGDAVRPLKLALEAVGPRAELDLAVLPEPARVPGLAALPARLAGRPSLLLVAATAADPLGDAERAALTLLAPLACALWPVVVTTGDDASLASGAGVNAATAERVAQSWGLSGAPLLPVSALDATSTTNSLPAWLASPRQPSTTPTLADALRALASSRSATSVIEMLQERHESDLAQLRSRLKREQRLEKSSEDTAADTAARAELDVAKQRSGEDFTSLAQSLREAQRRALLRNGVLGQLCSDLSQSVQPTDLVREEAGRVVRLALDRTVTDETRKRFGKGARGLLEEQCIVIRDTFELVRKRCEAALQSSGARNLGLPLEPPDPVSLWASLRDVVQLELRYRGELPRRGFLQRLGAGRQVAFGILMVLSLVGSFVGFNVRQVALVGLLLLLVFAAVVGWTYVSWKREDQRALELEIDKVRDGVRGELDRLAAEVSREMQTRLVEALEQTRRDFLARFDAAQREWAAEAANRMETERRDVRSRLKLIEQREREMAAVGQQLGKLRLQASQIAMGAMAALRAALQPPAARSMKAGAAPGAVA